MKRLVLTAVRSAPGRRLTRFVVRHSLLLAVDLDERARLPFARNMPAQLAGFEDLAFLFTSSQLNYGIAQLTFEESAYLFRVARSLGPARIAEIGRFRGGSTLVLATAMHASSQLDSYDSHAVGAHSGVQLDEELTEVLRRYGLDERVRLHVADSRTVEPPHPFDLVFVDGDHSYAGIRADVENWRRAIVEGGHLVMHGVPDRERVAEGGTPGTGRLGNELDAGAFGMRRVGGAGNIAHYVAEG